MPRNDFFSYGGPDASAKPASSAPRAEGGDPPRTEGGDPPRTEGGDPPRAILADLSDEDWEKFIGFAARRRYPDAAPIVRRGDREVALGLVASGAVRVQPARAAAVARGEGEAFGVVHFLDGAASDVEVFAQGPAEVLLLGREALLQLAAWQPRIAVALLRDLGAHVAGRLRRVQGVD